MVMNKFYFSCWIDIWRQLTAQLERREGILFAYSVICSGNVHMNTPTRTSKKVWQSTKSTVFTPLLPAWFSQYVDLLYTLTQASLRGLITIFPHYTHTKTHLSKASLLLAEHIIAHWQKHTIVSQYFTHLWTLCS